jgi:2-polyprenyl-3-methyl-5-hydroxy-6-metoxy-1,4-benzoquinol methylase
MWAYDLHGKKFGRRQMASEYETEIDFEDRSRPHTLIVELVGHDKRVLDVGTSTGYLAEVLVQRGCRVTGIEVDLEAARQAEEHCERVIVGDVETTLDVYEELAEESFDVIVFGDLLEHLKDPLRTLLRLRPFLRSGGYVVASIPNVAHGSVRLALMQGKFQYRPLGLLDNAHLRFFTRESIEQLFNDAGFEITGLERTTRDIFDTEIEIDEELITKEVLQPVRNDPEALTYQFVLAARPSEESEMIAKPYTRIRPLLDQVAERDQTIYELNRKLRNLQDLQRQLDHRTEQLAEKEEEVAALTQEMIDRNKELAKNERQIRRLNDQVEQRERQIRRLSAELERLRMDNGDENSRYSSED